MNSYTKLFNSIVTSTIWTENDKTRIVWITMLAISDKNGEVQASVPGLARIAGVGVEDCREAINKFLSPDPDSRTKDDEGRRIEEIDGGWSLLNHGKYRALASDDDRREKAAERKRREREKKQRNGDDVTHESRPCHARVTHESHQNPQAEAEAEADSKADALKKNTKRGARTKFTPPTIDEAKAYAAEIGMAVDDAENFHDHFESNGWKVGGRSSMKDWKAAMRKWNRNTPSFKKPTNQATTRRAEKASREYHEEPIPIPNLEDDD